MRRAKTRYGVPLATAKLMDAIFKGALQVIAKAKAEGKFWSEKDEKHRKTR
jgi:hypothetical protein